MLFAIRRLSFSNAVVFEPEQELDLEVQDEPAVLSLDGQEEHELKQADRVIVKRAEAVARFEQLLPRVRQRWRDAEGWEAAWLGKGAGTIVRLAGLLTLMHWAQDPKDEVPQKGVTARRLEEAYALWADYFHPHAVSVFQQAGSDNRDATVRPLSIPTCEKSTARTCHPCVHIGTVEY